jgi:hypothetical protein
MATFCRVPRDRDNHGKYDFYFCYFNDPGPSAERVIADRGFVGF